MPKLPPWPWRNCKPATPYSWAGTPRSRPAPDCAPHAKSCRSLYVVEPALDLWLAGMCYAGAGLSVGTEGAVGIGLGSGSSSGTVGLIAPTLDITHTGQEEVLDGVRMIFQVTPGTEAPSEMNFLFPDRRALCMAENATHNLHNLLTLRGAEVRDARNWSRYIAEAIEMFADGTEVAFASHHWPTWGRDNVVTFLAEQRDLYAYLHDQTLRMMNQGYVGTETPG